VRDIYAWSLDDVIGQETLKAAYAESRSAGTTGVLAKAEDIF